MTLDKSRNLDESSRNSAEDRPITPDKRLHASCWEKGMGSAGAPKHAIIAIGSFCLDLNKQQLLREGCVLSLRPKSFDVLRYIATNPGRVISKDEIFQAVWPGISVTDDSLVQCISEIRHVLGDEGQTLVRTLPRRGYLFAPSEPAVQSNSSVTLGARGPGMWWRIARRAHAALPAKLAGVVTGARLGMVLAVIACVGVLLSLLPRENSSKPRSIRSVAILPFEPLLDEGLAHRNLAQGLADLVVMRLIKLGVLRVVPPSTAASLQERSALDTGRHLGVDAVLEGRLYKQNNRLRVTAHLLRVSDGETIWSDRFVEDTNDVFKAEEEIALHLADSMVSKLESNKSSPLPHPNSVIPEANTAYARGRFLLGRRTGPSVERAITSFESAIQIDRNFAIAHAALAESLNLVGAYGGVEPRSAFLRAKEAALKALELQPALAASHVALAFAKAHAEYDWPAARAGYLRGIELSPTDATAWQWLALADAANGQHAEALQNVRTAHRIDPLSLIVSVDVGRHLYYEGSYQAAVEQLLRTIDLDPGFVRAHHELGRAHLQMGRFDEAIASAKRAVDLSGRSDSALAALANAQARSGDLSSANMILAELRDRQRQRYVASYHLAVIYAGLGDTDAAVDNLERAYDERFNWTVFINVEPDFASVRQHPRFARLTEKMNLMSHDKISIRVNNP